MVSLIRNLFLTTLLALVAYSGFSEAPSEEEKEEISTNPSNRALLDEAKELVTSDDQNKDVVRAVALGHTYFGPCLKAATSRAGVKECVKNRHEMLKKKMSERKSSL